MKRKSFIRNLSHSKPSVMNTNGYLSSRVKRDKNIVSKTDADKYDGEQGVYIGHLSLEQEKCEKCDSNGPTQ